MKIIQTFWSGNKSVENYLSNKGGWRSAEYHWMAWALSCLQLRKFYKNVELVTDTAGKTVFQEILNLPYSQITASLDVLNKYDTQLWALAKIYTYSLQKEPFIHIDGDVFIWKKFSESIENASLIAQNLEIDFPFYKEPLQTIQQEFNNVPKSMIAELENDKHIYSCNTGVIGGHNLGIFKEYKKLAFDFVDDNIENLSKVDTQHFNICFEQFLYYSLTKIAEINIEYVIKKEFDPTYPNYADFHEVPNKTWFIHAMAAYKQSESVCYHLARRLRNDFPEHYYNIIDICLKHDIELDWKCYPLEKLDTEWLRFYEKDKTNYVNVEMLFSKPRNEIFATKLVFSKDCSIEEIENIKYNQILQYPNVIKISFAKTELDSLNIVLLDAFQEKICVYGVIQAIKPYFDVKEIEQNPTTFEDLVLSRIKEFMILGVLELT